MYNLMHIHDKKIKVQSLFVVKADSVVLNKVLYGNLYDIILNCRSRSHFYLLIIQWRTT